MTARQRGLLFAVAAAGFATFLIWGLSGLPAFGHYRGPYGYVIDAVTVHQIHATGLVSGVNFFYRGFDTVGEEFILFVAVTGVAVVMRGLREEEEARGGGPPSASIFPTSDGVRMLALVLVGPVLLVGWELTTHAQSNPSGGFQGGAVMASSVILIYLAGHYLRLRRSDPQVVTDSVEAMGAAGFAIVGLFGMVAGSAFLADVLPLGKYRGAVTSAGTIPLISLCVGIEVWAAFLLVVSEYLGQTLVRKGAMD